MHNLRFYLTVILFFGFLITASAQGLPPGWGYQVTPSNHVIAIPLSANPNINGRPLDAGDYIGVFFTNDQGNLICGGATEWNGTSNAGIIAFGNDPFTPYKNGFSSGEVFTYKVYSYYYGCEFIAQAECNSNLPTTCQQYFSNGLSGVISLDANGYFQPVWESPYNPMTFYIVDAQYNGQPLQHCDEIGIFDIDPFSGEEICVGRGILSEVLGGGNYLEMIASMNDGSQPGEANGFTPGNTFIFKFYSQQNGLLGNIDYTFPYAGYDEVYTPQGSAIVALSGATVIYDEQILQLPAGWSSVSSYLAPGNTSMVNVVSGISGQLEMINNLNAFYQPGNPAGTLAAWNYQSGYFIKTSSATNLTISGLLPASTIVGLQPGWNLIPVLTDQEVSIGLLFGQNLPYVEMIKDAVGLLVYWPDKEIMTLQSLKPGKAYMVKVSQGFDISF